ncbi:beta-lactamase family protein [bacterium]|nr:beta-lactamase family protein [bacterium]
MLSRTADLLSDLVAAPLIFAPGSRAEYSNTAFALLGHAAARAADPSRSVSWEQYLASEVLTPLGMDRTGFFNSFDGTNSSSEVTRQAVWGGGTSTATIEVNAAVTHAAGEAVPPQTRALGWTNPAGGLASCPRDMASFMKWALSASTTHFPSGGPMGACRQCQRVDAGLVRSARWALWLRCRGSRALLRQWYVGSLQVWRRDRGRGAARAGSSLWTRGRCPHCR